LYRKQNHTKKFKMSTVVHVKNISHKTSEKEVRDFFSFCGKISSISVTPDSESPESTKRATVTFEKETAAKTALLLDSTQLGPTQVHVSTDASITNAISSAASNAASSASAAVYGTKEATEEGFSQEDKPRSRIVAEYLAHGYALSDVAIQKAIELDQKHGVSTRFTTVLQKFDEKYHATDKARGLDQSYGVTDKATAIGQTGWQTLSSYFEKALGTPTGQKLANFYTTSEKQVRDVHAEARRLADLKKQGKTTCQCGGDSGECPCKEGQCACSGCAKSNTGMGENTATGKADIVADTTPMAPLGEKTI